MSTLLFRLGAASARHAKVVLGTWFAILALLVGTLLSVGSALDSSFSIPGSESQSALDRLTEIDPVLAGVQAQLVFVAPEGQKAATPAVKAAIESSLAAAAKAPQVARVISPFEGNAISFDGRTALAQVFYPVQRAELTPADLDALRAAVEPARAAGLEVEVGGSAFGKTGVEVGPTELVGVVVAMVVVTVTFGSLLAASMPLLTALIGVGVGLTGLLIASSFTTVSSTAPTLALMIGLAVGIDYALFIVSRHRSQLASGMDVVESAARSIGTAGSAVVFAGLTVIIALAGLGVVGIPFLTVMGLAAAATVLVAVAVALTAVPALMGLAGTRMIPRPGSRAERRERAASGTTTVTGTGGTPDRRGVAARPALGERWVRGVVRHPLLVLIACLVGLQVLAVPASDLRLALPDNGTAPLASSERRAYDIVSREFGPGANGPLIVMATIPTESQPQDATRDVIERLVKLPDVLVALAPANGAVDDTAVITVLPKSGPDAQATKDLVAQIRDLGPVITKATGTTIAVTGVTAVSIDVSDRLASSLLPFAAVVVGLALILLLLVFRSILVPVKAAAGFLLSVTASFGVVSAVFSWGWLMKPLGLEQTGPVVSFMPVILMAVLFGLAMDYEVFLVSRMREAYVHGADPVEAVVVGARHAARVVTAAALIMFAVFASFIVIDDVTIKAIALALAVGVMVDAFVVRMTLVPAVLALFGRASWWLPGWLDRLVPDLDIEGAKLDTSTPLTLTPADDARADAADDQVDEVDEARDAEKVTVST